MSSPTLVFYRLLTFRAKPYSAMRKSLRKAKSERSSHIGQPSHVCFEAVKSGTKRSD